MDEIADRAGQVEVEQRAIEVMYARLDAEVAAADAAREAALSSPVDGAESRRARDTELARLTGRLARLRSAEQSLCFGRIDGGESLHIGRIGLRSATGEVLLVDWRADAARPFYAATMAAPLGLRRRRHLRVAKRRVMEVTDEILDGTRPTTEDVVGDGPLVAALDGARTGRMREAAATLQREQDEIVRSEHRGVLVVDGGPGTGKTIVALHRAAYVLYAFPAIADRGVLVFGPNRRFLSYISDVLPSLAENNVALATGADLVGAEATRSEPEAIARAKGRRGFADAFADRVRAREPQGAPLRLTTAHGEVILDAARVDAARRGALHGGVGHNQARALFLEYVVDALVSELEQRTAREIADFEEELKQSAGIDLERLFAGESPARSGADPESSADGLDIDWDAIRDDLLGDRAIDRIIDRVWPRLDAEQLVRDLLTDRRALADIAPDLDDEHLTQITQGVGAGWSSADLVLLDEVRALVDGPPDPTYGHIVVDEAQQLSEMDWRMLMRRCPSRSMTIVGDLAQAGPTSTLTSWAEALAPFVADRYQHHTLTINYRTTAEILAAAAPVLSRIAPSQRLSHSIRHGEVPLVLATDADRVEATVAELVAQLRAEHPDQLIGIIAAAGHARTIERRSFADGAVVVAAAEARGLEFDTVVIVDPNEIEHSGQAGLRDLYVTQTRATRRLITITTGGAG